MRFIIVRLRSAYSCSICGFMFRTKIGRALHMIARGPIP